MTLAILDDHLLRDLLADEIGGDLARLLAGYEPATTNLYYVRLCKSVVSARGGQLTGSWTVERRRALGRTLLGLPDSVAITSMRILAFRMAELSENHRLSTLGAEAIAAAGHLGAPLCVWSGDDGPATREAALGAGVEYLTISS
ncbi:MAG: hypothetical protein ACRDZ8_09720 [Acidimicrobiales bacterium]